MAIADLTQDQLFGQMFDSTTGAVRTTGGSGGGGDGAVTGPLGRAADAASVSVALSTENVATLAAARQLAAGEAHVGEFGNNQITILVAQTVQAAAYSAGNAVGGLITFAGAARVSGAAGAPGTSGLVQSASIYSKALQTTQFDLILFSSNPTGSTVTDKTAIDVVAADFDKILGVAHITDWTALGATRSMAQAQNLAMPYALVSATSIYGALVCRGGPTFASTSDISVGLRLIRN